MVNPLLTVAFDLFLIGSALTIIAAMWVEAMHGRAPSVGAGGLRREAKSAAWGPQSHHWEARRSGARLAGHHRRRALAARG